MKPFRNLIFLTAFLIYFNLQLIFLTEIHNKDIINMILLLSTTIICFVIMSNYSILGNGKLSYLTLRSNPK